MCQGFTRLNLWDPPHSPRQGWIQSLLFSRHSWPERVGERREINKAADSLVVNLPQSEVVG